MKTVRIWGMILLTIGIASCGGSSGNSGNNGQETASKQMDVSSTHELTLYGAPYKLKMDNSDSRTLMVLTHDTGLVFTKDFNIDTLRSILRDDLHFDHAIEQSESNLGYEGLRFVTHRGKYLLMEAFATDPAKGYKEFINLRVDYLEEPGKTSVLSMTKKPMGS